MKLLVPNLTQAVTDITKIITKQGYQYDLIIAPFIYSWAIYTPYSYWHSPTLIGVFNIALSGHTFLVIYKNPRYLKPLRDTLAPTLQDYTQYLDPDHHLTIFMDPTTPTP